MPKDAASALVAVEVELAVDLPAGVAPVGAAGPDPDPEEYASAPLVGKKRHTSRDSPACKFNAPNAGQQ